MIRIDYNASRASAAKLSGAAQQCEQNIAQARQLLSTVPTYWEGEAAQAFAAQITQWISTNQQLQQQLEGLAGDIRRTADEFEAAEERIRLAAQQAAARAAAQAHAAGQAAAQAAAQAQADQSSQAAAEAVQQALEETRKKAQEAMDNLSNAFSKFF